MSVTITIENVCNVKRAELSIKKRCLNVKYGNNGTGKTSITKAIELGDRVSSAKELIPYGTKNVPSVTYSDPSEKFENVFIFNDAYVENNLFKKDDAIRNTFQIVVQTPDYIEKENLIKNKLNSILSILGTSDFLNNFVADIEEFGNEFQLTKDGELNKKLKAGAGLVDGYSVASVPDENPLKRHLTSVDTAAKWSDWFKEGASYVGEANKCPYCSATISEEVEMLQAQINAAIGSSMKKMMESITCFEKLTKYLGAEERSLINGWIQSGSPIDKSQAHHIDVHFHIVKEEADRISVFKNMKYDELVSHVLDNSLNDMLMFSKLDSTRTFTNMDAELNAMAEVNRFNDALDSVIAITSELSKDLQDLNEITRQNINGNTKYINDFLDIAGMPYEIIVEGKDRDAKTILKPRAGTKIPPKISEQLSYGEKNALSLLLFSLDAISGDHDLIILDDPISSFDNNKKYALLHQLFAYDKTKKLKNLRFKTVLMVTHDFSIVVDLIKQDLLTMVKNKCIDAKYLRNDGQRVYETSVNKESFKLRTEFEKQKFKDTSKPKICRMLHYRRYLELVGQMSTDKYTLASSFLHAYKVPLDIKEKKINNYKKIAKEIASTKGMEDFDYDVWYSSLDDAQIKDDYFKPSTTSLEKLEIVRYYILKQNESGKDATNIGDMMWKFICETYHIDNDTASVLDDEFFDTIPAHIIEKCNDLIKII